MNGRLFRSISVFFSLALLHSSCSSNAFEASDPGDPAEDAVIALENKSPSKAIKILTQALKSSPDHPIYLSILSAAYAQRAGISPIQFARDLNRTGAGTASTSQISIAFSILPLPTYGVLADIDESVAILGELGSARFLPGDALKLGLFQAAAFLLHTKALDKNGDGRVSPDEALDLSNASASVLLGQISSSKDQLKIMAGEDVSADEAAKVIEQFETGINQSEGETDEEKLRNYIAKSKGAGTTTP